MALFNTHYPYMGAASKTFEPIVYSQSFFSNLVRGNYNNAGIELNTLYRVSALTAIVPGRTNQICTVNPEQIALNAETTPIVNTEYTYSSIPSHSITTTSNSYYSSGAVVIYPYSNGFPNYIVFAGGCRHDSDGDYYCSGLCNQTMLTSTNQKLINPGKYYATGYASGGSRTTQTCMYIDDVKYGGYNTDAGSIEINELTISNGNVRIPVYAFSPINSQSYVILLLWKK